MDYANTYDKARIRFYARNMILEIDSDASYLVLPKSRSRYAGYFIITTLLTDIYIMEQFSLNVKQYAML